MEHEALLLEMKDITKRFPGVKALDHAQLSIRRGEVMAIVGENGAGKSTLMKLLLGIYAPDEGTILWKGKEVRFHSPHDAIASGISMIHQETSLMPTMSVAENIWVGREHAFTRFGILNTKQRDQKTKEILAELGLGIDPRETIKNLSVAQNQLVEVARAISYHSDLIIMDEPTSSLAEADIALLYRIIREITAKGTSVIFISHKLEEVLTIADRVTAMRDGCYIATADAKECTQDDLIKWIVGREMKSFYPKVDAKIGDTVLEVRHLKTLDKRVRDVSFSIRKGEILGFAGLVGAGRTETMRALFGIDPIESGELLKNGKKLRIHSPEQAIRHGIGMVTEDRLRMGIFAKLPVRHNISAVYLKWITNFFGMVDRRAEEKDCRAMQEKMEIKVSGLSQLVSNLSGGNQQKVILARWLLSKPEILILDEPTRGIDVGAKAEIHHQISLLAQQGMAIILISSELEEVMSMSDRLIVMNQGRVAGEHLRGTATSEQIMREAFGTQDHNNRERVTP